MMDHGHKDQYNWVQQDTTEYMSSKNQNSTAVSYANNLDALYSTYCVALPESEL